MARVIVISGGGTGIGRATAEAAARDGDTVLLLGRRADVVEKAAREIEAATRPGAAGWFAADVSDTAQVEAVAKHVSATYGTIDAIVNNAGGPVRMDAGGLEGVAALWRATFDKNVLSAVLLTEALTPMLRRPGGRIVLVSSMATRSGGGNGPYGAAKAALHGWVLNLAVTYGREGITANVVLPGYTPDTEFFGPGMPREVHDRIVSRIVLGRPASSADVAGAIRYLISPEASFVTGQLLEVAGGTLPPNM